MPLPGERRTSQPYEGYGTMHQMLSSTLRPHRGAYGAEISLQISALPGFEPWTSYLAVQQATARPSGIPLWAKDSLKDPAQ